MVHGRKVPRVLVLTPTRELAAQIDDNVKAYAKNVKVRTALIFGGVSQHRQVAQLRKGADVLVATPGRLLDLCNQGLLSLEWIEFLVLDEADTMLDMGFIHDIRKVIAMIPEKRQSLFFSATMPESIVKLSKTILTNPIRVEVARVSSAAETVDQRMMFVSQGAKRDLLVHLLNRSDVETALVFTRTKYGADKVVRYLRKNNIRGEAIHGNKSQPQRDKAMNAFRKGKVRVLVATDIAARGIDVEGVSHVINFEIPNISETSVHRIGRTGRAGRKGMAISMVNEGDERNHMRDIVRLIKRDIPLEKNHQWHLDLPLIHADSKTIKVPKKEKVNPQDQGGRRQSGKTHGNHSGSGAPKQKNNRHVSKKGANQVAQSNQQGKSQDERTEQGRPHGKRRWKKKPKFRGPRAQGDRPSKP